MTKADYFSNVMKNKIDDNFGEMDGLLEGLKEGETAVFKLDMSVQVSGGKLVPSGVFLCQKKLRGNRDAIDQEPFDPDQPDMFDEKK